MTTQTVQCTVVGLQTNPIAAGVPAVAGAVLTWNGTSWVPGGIDVVLQGTLQVVGATVVGGSMSVNGNLNPNANNNFNLGATALAWNNGYITNIYGTVQGASDPRLKKHIHDVPSTLGVVRAIPARTFRFKTESDDGPLHYGFLTTEVQEVMGKQFAGVKTDNDGGMHTLVYTEMIAVLWRAVQELAAQVALLAHDHQIEKDNRRTALSN